MPTAVSKTNTLVFPFAVQGNGRCALLGNFVKPDESFKEMSWKKKKGKKDWGEMFA